MTEDGDLGFRVFYLDGKQKIDVVPFNRVDCHTFMEEGRIVCTQTTKCTFKIWSDLLLFRALLYLFRCIRVRQQLQLPKIQENLVQHCRRPSHIKLPLRNSIFLKSFFL